MSNRKIGMEEILKEFEDKIIVIDDLLAFATEHDCSDVYIKTGDRPFINRFGKIYEVPSLPINSLIWADFSNIAIKHEQNSVYVRKKMLDLSYEVDVPKESIFYKQYDKFRYRVSVGFSRKENIATFRMIKPVLPSFKRINFPKKLEGVLKKSFETRSGIIMFVGPTGSGKSTTMAACIHEFSKKNGPLDNSVVITLEDPIEYIHESRSSVKITQKELDQDFSSFPLGVKQALRERPTHIVCGEIRDREGIATCVEASRTGHKVLTSFHTEDVPGTIARMYNYLAGENQEIMYDLISNMDFVLCQRLHPSDNKFILETQYMVFTEEIKLHLQKVISEGKNISISIDTLIKSKSLQETGLVKDWD